MDIDKKLGEFRNSAVASQPCPLGHITSKTTKEITELLTTTVKEKLKTYQPETLHKAFSP